ncbi:MAG: chemotaxis protein [Rhodocyclaceae bacterium]|nr:chemotaxis protein [Rhodocyclaceae bacterium]
MTTQGHAVREIHLNPGDLWFGGGLVRLRTVLGSCVSITLWHPQRRIGGMCHFMLPGRVRSKAAELSGKYADEAFQIFDAEMSRAGTRHREYQAKIFGGGNMFPNAGIRIQGDVGQRNVEIAHKLLARRGIEVVVQHVGGAGHRKLIFDVWNGDAWLNFQDMLAERSEKA